MKDKMKNDIDFNHICNSELLSIYENIVKDNYYQPTESILTNFEKVIDCNYGASEVRKEILRRMRFVV